MVSLKGLIFVLLLIVPLNVAGQQAGPATAYPPKLFGGMGNLHHPVSTRNAEAQRFFDQGLTFAYAFNHDEAVRSFTRASQLDPELAMAYWGIALALGPNINLDVDAERELAAYEAVQKALALAPKAPAYEQTYINALAKRYSKEPKADLKMLSADYRDAMARLVRAYPDDVDAATLYAESMMDLRPWRLWSLDGKPAPDTEEIVAVLQSVLRREPDHIGANHYFVHAVEASPHPEWALPSAKRLETLVPAAGHLIHMPAHVYMRVGDYTGAARLNDAAVAADEAYIRERGTNGIYPMMYYSHNLHFLTVAHSMQGRYADAIKAANRLVEFVGPRLKERPGLQGFMATPFLVQVRFRQWEQVLTSKAPDPDMAVIRALWHFSRGMAYAATGRVGETGLERQALVSGSRTLSSGRMYGANPAERVLEIARTMLDARIAISNGERQSAVALLKKAVEAEEQLNYDEPSDWYLFPRESLGGLLLQEKNYREAELVFRADLQRNRRSGRSLFGLLESVKRQGKADAVPFVQREFDAAWQNADVILRVEDL